MGLTSINMDGACWVTYIKALLASTAQPGSESLGLERIHFRTISSEVWMASTNGTIATIAHTIDSAESDVDDTFSIDADDARTTLTMVSHVTDEGSASGVMVSLAVTGGSATIHIHSDFRSVTLTTSSHEGLVQVIAGATLKELYRRDPRPYLIDADLLKTASTSLEGRLMIQQCASGSLTAMSDDGNILTVIVPIRYSGPSGDGPSTRVLETWTEHLKQLNHQPTEGKPVTTTFLSL